MFRSITNNIKDTNNHYMVLDKANEFGFLHDATSHWVRELNTIMIRAAREDGKIFKVPFSMNQVPGSLTGEALCSELVNELS